MLIWVLQWSQCFKIGVAQHWGGRGHIIVRIKVWGVNLKNLLENSRETVSVSTICDEYCSNLLNLRESDTCRSFGVIDGSKNEMLSSSL